MTEGNFFIPVNRPYLGGTVPLLLYTLLSHFRKSTSINHNKVAIKDDSEKREYNFISAIYIVYEMSPSPQGAMYAH